MNQLERYATPKAFLAAMGLREAAWSRDLPANLSVGRFMRSAMLAVTKTPRLLDCDTVSIMACLNAAVNLGLDVSGNMNMAHLIPFKTTCTLVIGYRGIIDVCTRGGAVTHMDAYLIREGDTIEVEYGTSPRIRHVPDWRGNGKVLGAYATAKLRSGDVMFTPIMPLSEIEAIRDRSHGYRMAKQYGKSSPWDTDFPEMAKKSALRRLGKLVPVSIEALARALEVDDAADRGEAPAPIDVVAEDVTTSDPEPATAAIDAALSNNKQ